MQKNKKPVIISFILAFCFLLSGCGGKNAAQDSTAPADVLKLTQYASLIGMTKAEALEAFGVKEDELAEGPSRSTFWLPDRFSREVNGMQYRIYVGFSGDEYLAKIAWHASTDGLDDEQIFMGLVGMQDELMRVFGRPHTYNFDEGLTTDVFLPDMLDLENEYNYFDRWVAKEALDFPGIDRAIVMAELAVRNSFDMPQETWNGITLVMGVMDTSMLRAPLDSGYIFL